jgi:hypothetical protein
MTVYARAAVNPDGVPYGDQTSLLPTYAAGASFVPTTGTLLHLQGSATKVVTLRGFSITGVAGQVGSLTFELRKTTTAPTGGTSTLVTPVTVDPADADATATLRYYTAAPTPATSVGSFFTFLQFFPTASGGQGESQSPRELSPFPGAAPVVIRGANEGISFYTASAALNNPNIQISISWTETDFYP